MRYIVGVVIVVAVVMAGCGTQAVPVDRTELGLAVAWDGALGMERESRPRIEWYADACRVDPGVDLREQHATVYRDGCLVAVVGNDGLIKLRDGARLSDTGFAYALGLWRSWLLQTRFVQGSEWHAAQNAIIDAGL